MFDNPPELYFHYKKNYGEELAKTALHVIVLDEFDAFIQLRSFCHKSSTCPNIQSVIILGEGLDGQ